MKNKKKSSTNFLFVIILLIILGIIFFLLFKYNFSEKYDQAILNKKLFDYVFEICNCPNMESNITGIFNDVNSYFYKEYFKYTQKEVDNSECSKIKNNLLYENVSKIISYFQSLNLLTFSRGKDNILQPKEGKYYLLNTYKKLSWKNIKQLSKDDCKQYYSSNKNTFISIYNIFNSNLIENREPTENEFEKSTTYFKYIFWYFRKAIVDTILSRILLKYNTTSISVGSTNVTSDYDMTLYGGSYINISNTILEFKKNFMNIFNEDSDFIFDTNLYGMSFIDIENSFNELGIIKFDRFFSDNFETCTDKKFKYVKSDKLTYISQHIWVIVKLLMKLKEVEDIDELVYEYFYKKVYNFCNNNSSICMMLKESIKTINMYSSEPENLPQILSLINKKDVSTITPNYFNSFISYICYNSLESYYCRGTFLDVVVNQQMCKKELVILNEDEYLDSFIENLSELITHYHKDKYLKRAKNAWKNFNKKNKKYAIEMEVNDLVEKNLNNIEKLQINCNKEDMLIECDPFVIMDNCLEIIIQIMSNCFSDIDPKIVENAIKNFIIEEN